MAPPLGPPNDRDEESFTLAFVGHADAASAAAAISYEDAVLPLLADHGAELRYRGRRAGDQDASLPLEVHLIWFPSRGAFEAYLADERRIALLAEHGEVFTSKEVVVLDTIDGDASP
jgi:hypothetical protein